MATDVPEGSGIVEIRMPELGSDMTEADLVAWLVDAGDDIAEGDLIAEIETDKSTVEFESPCSGRVVELCVEAPQMGVKVGELIARIEAHGATETELASEPAPPAAPAPAEAAEATPTPQTDAVVPATALARRIADQRGVDLQSVTPSGPSGRITKADVESASDSPSEAPAPAAASSSGSRGSSKSTGSQGGESLSRMRRTIAARLSEAKREVPHFYLEAVCAADALVDVRGKLNANSDAGRLSVNDFCVAAAARALRDVPEANVAWRGDSIERFETVDIAVAVAMPDGLITPVVREADRLGLHTLSAQLRELVERARAGQLEPREYSGGLNLSNLGMYGITAVWPIVNPPHACILGLGAIEEVPVVRNGEVVPGLQMTATLSADHRAVDGAIGAQLLAAFRRYIEHPLEMML